MVCRVAVKGTQSAALSLFFLQAQTLWRPPVDRLCGSALPSDVSAVVTSGRLNTNNQTH